MWIEVKPNKWIQGDRITGVALEQYVGDGGPWLAVYVEGGGSWAVVQNPDTTKIPAFLQALSTRSHIVLSYDELKAVLT